MERRLRRLLPRAGAELVPAAAADDDPPGAAKGDVGEPVGGCDPPDRGDLRSRARGEVLVDYDAPQTLERAPGPRDERGAGLRVTRNREGDRRRAAERDRDAPGTELGARAIAAGAA